MLVFRDGVRDVKGMCGCTKERMGMAVRVRGKDVRMSGKLKYGKEGVRTA